MKDFKHPVYWNEICEMARYLTPDFVKTVVLNKQWRHDNVCMIVYDKVMRLDKEIDDILMYTPEPYKKQRVFTKFKYMIYYKAYILDRCERLEKCS